MCSTILQVVFGVLLVAGAALTIVALATPEWRKMTHNDKSGKNDNYWGFFQCFSSDNTKNECYKDFKNSPDWKKAALACMVLSVAACLVGLVWSCIACFMCCCKSCLTPPLPILAGLACVLDVVAVIIYGVKYPDDIGYAPASSGDLQNKSAFGYSFWVGIGAIIVLFVTLSWVWSW